IGIPYSYHSPQAYLDTNISGTLNVLQAARTLDLEKVIHTSTSECYGSAQFVPITENHPLVGQSPYSATKIAADQLAYSFYASFDTPVVTLRPFNTFGPRQSARAVIPAIITQIQNGKREIELGNLNARRDFNYIKDTVHGFIQAGNCEQKGLGQVFNVCSGVDFSIEETVKLIAQACNVDISINVKEERVRPEKSEVDRLLGDCSKAKESIGYEPKFSGKEGFLKALGETINWFSNKENLIHYKANIYNI
ncbi:MAG: GDP-mannose 4,6-dehydratase, partial [Halobacteriovoraceae bacterium]|nr:GDP-mannose 4,6-dehydratase [Halobacteriovoraceae bacterium]